MQSLAEAPPLFYSSARRQFHMFLKNDRVNPFWDLGTGSEAVSLLTRCVAVVKEGENYLHELDENNESDEGRRRIFKSAYRYFIYYFSYV